MEQFRSAEQLCDSTDVPTHPAPSLCCEFSIGCFLLGSHSSAFSESVALYRWLKPRLCSYFLSFHSTFVSPAPGSHLACLVSRVWLSGISWRMKTNISEWEAQGKFWWKSCKHGFRKSLPCLTRSGVCGELRPAPGVFHVAKWTDAETPILSPPDVKSWLIWKDPDAAKDWRQEEKGLTDDEMVGWHHRFNGREFG